MSKPVITRILLSVLLLALVVSGVGCTKEVSSDEAIKENYIAVETEKVLIDSIENTTRFNGKIIANEEIVVMSKLVGVVDTVNVELGDKVAKDTILFTLDQEDLSKNTQQAENALSSAKKSVEQSLNALNSATLNFQLTKEKIDNAILNHERNKELYAVGGISKAQLEQSELAASTKQLEVAELQVKQAEIAYQQAQNQLTQSHISFDQAMRNFDNTVVKAPMDGIVSTLNVKEGAIATSSQAAAVIVDAQRVYMQLNIVETLVNKLSVGQEVELYIPAAFDEAITATIDYISPTTDARNQLYTVKIYVDNTSGKIRPGMNGEARLSVDRIDSALIIQSDAVIDKDGDSVVYVLEDDKAVERNVTTGLDTGDFVEILSGLEEGEEVIVKGQHYVENGQKVQVVRGE
ncbi:efflux RND transporter periplasmic adaptor subunit [Alkaliphilus serpentinus]|uniref:Efflux RND transporter periplasmic adaptor subunit n=1 Tax=Alkaliphilus serpentinus TaxID=1482731 RepID=A0A833HPD1_9FIRM|nr:efflux RND transporter periplasmic adaptor subunit [Alkaliphilus serpentinus]KAB3529687.1 efflux RND transporter periplasmic adaptor subunit [Alkaliphilus serpentinus]